MAIDAETSRLADLAQSLDVNTGACGLEASTPLRQRPDRQPVEGPAREMVDEGCSPGEHGLDLRSHESY